MLATEILGIGTWSKKEKIVQNANEKTKINCIKWFPKEWISACQVYNVMLYSTTNRIDIENDVRCCLLYVYCVFSCASPSPGNKLEELPEFYVHFSTIKYSTIYSNQTYMYASPAEYCIWRMTHGVIAQHKENIQTLKTRVQSSNFTLPLHYIRIRFQCIDL